MFDQPFGDRGGDITILPPKAEPRKDPFRGQKTEWLLHLCALLIGLALPVSMLTSLDRGEPHLILMRILGLYIT